MSLDAYASDIDAVFEMITEDGGPIKIYGVAAEDATSDNPWLGSDDEPPHVDHVALVLPMSTVISENTDPYQMMALIPAKGLTFVLTADMSFEDAGGKRWQIVRFQTLIPDMVNPILYMAEVQGWPTK